MPKQRRINAPQAARDDEPYSVVEVKLQIRILGKDITRSRLAVNIYPDPALIRLAKQGLSDEQYGETKDGAFAACLSEDFSGWEDMNHDYPVLVSRTANAARTQDVRAMNEYISRSVDWVMALHRKARK